MSGQVWRPAEDTERLVCRRVSLDGLDQVGVVPLYYDLRVRAGLVGNASYWEWDWPAGWHQRSLTTLYSQALHVLAHRYVPGVAPSVFTLVPQAPVDVPWYRDSPFSRTLREVCDTKRLGDVTRLVLPEVDEIIGRWRKAKITAARRLISAEQTSRPGLTGEAQRIAEQLDSLGIVEPLPTEH